MDKSLKDDLERDQEAADVGGQGPSVDEVDDPLGLRAHTFAKRFANAADELRTCRHCLKVAKVNSDGDCDATCTRKRIQSFYHRERLGEVARQDYRMAISLGQACRAHGTQLAKDAEAFEQAGQPGLALDFRQRSAWLLDMAETLDQ